MEDNKKIKWHPGFYAGLEYELRKYRNILEYISEYVLSKEPIQMDLLVIKKNEDCDIDESFAKADIRSTGQWFYDFTGLKTITGLQYLNTSKVTDMAAMFGNCNQLDYERS